MGSRPWRPWIGGNGNTCSMDIHTVFRGNKPQEKASFSVKDYLALRILKLEYKRVVFFENGKRVAELMPSDGKWSIPAIDQK